MDAIVDRDDGPARRKGRQHVVRCVEQRGAGAAQAQRHHQLFPDGVVGRSLGDGPEVLAERRGQAGVAAPAEQHVLRFAIDSRKLVQEIAHVCADAEVVELAYVDCDPHR